MAGIAVPRDWCAATLKEARRLHDLGSLPVPCRSRLRCRSRSRAGPRLRCRSRLPGVAVTSSAPAAAPAHPHPAAAPATEPARWNIEPVAAGSVEHRTGYDPARPRPTPGTPGTHEARGTRGSASPGSRETRRAPGRLERTYRTWARPAALTSRRQVDDLAGSREGDRAGEGVLRPGQVRRRVVVRGQVGEDQPPGPGRGRVLAGLPGPHRCRSGGRPGSSGKPASHSSTSADLASSVSAGQGPVSPE